jgi:HPt (histidine-containing phosphotransfer) domain-containing protein
MSIWGGKVDSYKKFLGKFARDYADMPQAMLDSAQASDYGAVRAMAHKLKGAAANLGLPDVARVAEVVERIFSGIEPALPTGDEAELKELHDALKIAVASIASYIGGAHSEEQAMLMSALSETQRDFLASRLLALLLALDKDNPEAAEPVVESIVSLLPATSVAAVQAALDNFDFRKAEAATRDLAKTLDIALET